MKDHAMCGEWKQVGRGVYCACGVRLYQGTAPKGEPARKEMSAALNAIITAAIKRSEEQGDAPLRVVS